MKTLSAYLPSFAFIAIAITLSLLTLYYPPLTNFFHTDIIGIYFSIALLFFVGIGVHKYAPKTPIPVYVWAILFGMALQLPLLSFVSDRSTLLIFVHFFAAFVLFASGIHVPTRNFKRYFAPIASLSILATVLSIILFALTLSFVTQLYGMHVSAITLLVLGAILSSVDPSSVIQTLDKLHFKRPFIRDIAVSESAVNDVVGVIFTRFFLVAAVGTLGTATLTIGSGFMSLFTSSAFTHFSAEIVWGILVGLLGAWILKTWGASVGKQHWSDPALFFSVPIFCLALGSLVGGAGFLAAFVAGLLFENHTHTKEEHLFFDGLVDRFLKPVVFVLLGALAPLYMLIDTITIGTIIALLFMFLIRPIVVYLSLLPWMIEKKSLIHLREALFLSFVRETGAISAILILLTVALGIINTDFIFAIGLWVIIYTLVIEPPLTPLIAKRLEVAR
jgi:cell volume regulation protein A